MWREKLYMYVSGCVYLWQMPRLNMSYVFYLEVEKNK